MIVDCIVREFKLYDKEAETAAREIKTLSNDGYRVSVHYSAFLSRLYGGSRGVCPGSGCWKFLSRLYGGSLFRQQTV